MNYQTEITLLTHQIEKLLEAYHSQKSRIIALERTLAETELQLAQNRQTLNGFAEEETQSKINLMITEVNACLTALKEG